MSYNLVIQAEAILDIEEAFEWYEKQIAGLGYEPMEEMEMCYEKLSEHPEHYTYINERYRRIKVNRFPYLLVFEVESNDVIINSMYHAKRKSRH